MQGGWTPLMRAAQSGHADVAVRLLDAKANPDLALPTGETAMQIAEINKHRAIATVFGRRASN